MDLTLNTENGDLIDFVRLEQIIVFGKNCDCRDDLDLNATLEQVEILVSLCICECNKF